MKVLRYNWEKIKVYTNYDCKKIIEYMDFLHLGVLENKKNFSLFKKISAVSKERPNFILNYKDLYKSKTYTILERCIYLDLAAHRNYADYELKNEVFVPIVNIQHLYDVNKLKSNRLITVNGKKIDLKFEIGDKNGD